MKKALITGVTGQGGSSLAELQQDTPEVVAGQSLVALDPQYFRPTEVETLLGDPGMARKRRGRESGTSFEAMAQEMVASDLGTARRHKLLASHGYNVAISLE